MIDGIPWNSPRVFDNRRPVRLHELQVISGSRASASCCRGGCPCPACEPLVRARSRAYGSESRIPEPRERVQESVVLLWLRGEGAEFARRTGRRARDRHPWPPPEAQSPRLWLAASADPSGTASRSSRLRFCRSRSLPACRPARAAWRAASGLRRSHWRSPGRPMRVNCGPNFIRIQV